MKRNVKDLLEHNLATLGRKLTKLRREHWKGVGWEEYPTPIHHGYTRTYVLRDDVAKRKDASYFQRILDACNVVQFSHDKSFRYNIKHVSSDSRFYGKYLNSQIELRQLNKSQYDQLFSGDNAIPQRFQSDFLVLTNTSRWGGQIIKSYEYAKDWQFVIKVDKNMVTRVKLYDAELESQIKEIENYITTNDLWHKIYDWGGSNYYKRDDDERRVNIEKFDKKMMMEDLNDLTMD